MSQKHMLTDADILTITEIVSGCIETVMVSINELKADVSDLKSDVKHLKKQARFTNEGMSMIRADLTNVHRRLDHVELVQLDTEIGIT